MERIGILWTQSDYMIEKAGETDERERGILV